MGREVLGYVQQVLNSSQGQPKRPDCERRKRHATGNFSIQPFNRSALLVGLLSTGVLAANNEAGYRQVGDAYEALMLRNLYTQMQQANSMGDDDPDNQFAPSNAEKIFRGMRDEVMIQSLAKRRPLGVSDMIVRRLQGKGGVREGARVELNSGIQVQH
ncbi:MAG: rod-binding protein [Bdellovibrionota bacterium]